MSLLDLSKLNRPNDPANLTQLQDYSVIMSYGLNENNDNYGNEPKNLFVTKDLRDSNRKLGNFIKKY